MNDKNNLGRLVKVRDCAKYDLTIAYFVTDLMASALITTYTSGQHCGGLCLLSRLESFAPTSHIGCLDIHEWVYLAILISVWIAQIIVSSVIGCHFAEAVC